MINKSSQLQEIFRKDNFFEIQTSRHYERIRSSERVCKTPDCYGDLVKWSDLEIKTIGNRLVDLYDRKKPFRILVTQLKSQNRYTLYDKETDTGFIRRAWMDAANSINRVFDVYIKGEKPRYPKIDSISYNKEDTGFLSQVKEMMVQISGRKSEHLFYEIGLLAALKILKINGRQEAVQYEPLTGGMNHAAFLRIRQTIFSGFTYSVILIPGLGPEVTGQALAPDAAKRCIEGVQRYRQGLAPFIVVSGGNVHPFRTPFNEAEEMKKFIVEKLHVPADVVFIEPHARHTTTNIRNVSRMIYRFGLPGDKPVLVVTDSSQANYIAGRMGKTALRDLGYLPFSRLTLLNAEEVEFYPVKLSLQPDPFDPLDP